MREFDVLMPETGCWGLWTEQSKNTSALAIANAKELLEQRKEE